MAHGTPSGRPPPLIFSPIRNASYYRIDDRQQRKFAIVRRWKVVVKIFSGHHRENFTFARLQGEDAPLTCRPSAAAVNNRFVAIDLHRSNSAIGYASGRIFLDMSF